MIKALKKWNEKIKKNGKQKTKNETKKLKMGKTKKKLKRANIKTKTFMFSNFIFINEENKYFFLIACFFLYLSPSIIDYSIIFLLIRTSFLDFCSFNFRCGLIVSSFFRSNWGKLAWKYQQIYLVMLYS